MLFADSDSEGEYLPFGNDDRLSNDHASPGTSLLCNGSAGHGESVHKAQTSDHFSPLQGSRMRSNFSMLRVKKIWGCTSVTSRSRGGKQVSATLKVSLWFSNRQTLGSYRGLNQSDSEGQTPLHGPDIPVRVCTFKNACAAAVKQRERWVVERWVVEMRAVLPT